MAIDKKLLKENIERVKLGLPLTVPLKYLDGEIKRYFVRKPSVLFKLQEWAKKHPERVKEAQRRYRMKPEVKERKKEYYRKYIMKPEVKKNIKAYFRKYYAKPEVKERRKEYFRKYHAIHYAIPELRERKKEYFRKRYAIPEVKERMIEYSRKYYQEHKNELHMQKH